ncbi:MAG: PEP-CTERM/exosortase system-associated acyltransferase [Planctomycetes bacterium]|nr:PEP-CTERM/exosortase system-associated acyltransferase [Planctomycetota bacterium]
MSHPSGATELTPTAQRILAGGRPADPRSEDPIWDRYVTAFHVDPGDVVAMQAVFALRFEVYCRDRRFLPEEDYPDGQERDSYDAHSEQVLALDRDEKPAGAIRLVRSQVQGDLPFEAHCPRLWPDYAVDDRRACAEISRMVVHRDFRVRRDACAGAGGDGHARMPLLLLALYRQLYRISRRLGIRWWYAAMEVPHARAFAGLGFSFTAIGPITDYYGPVAPYRADLRDIEASLAATQPRLLDWFQRG